MRLVLSSWHPATCQCHVPENHQLKGFVGSFKSNRRCTTCKCSIACSQKALAFSSKKLHIPGLGPGSCSDVPCYQPRREIVVESMAFLTSHLGLAQVCAFFWCQIYMTLHCGQEHGMSEWATWTTLKSSIIRCRKNITLHIEKMYWTNAHRILVYTDYITHYNHVVWSNFFES